MPIFRSAKRWTSCAALIRANPGEVTLLATGPMTDIGLLFAIDPEFRGC